MQLSTLTVTVTTNPKLAILSVFAVGEDEEQELVSRSIILENHELQELTNWLASL